jgi:regulation of enolase protein 1 (concanavalin A-like superfamily)
MSAWGTDIYGTADQCRFAYKSLTGNGTIIAKVESIDNSDPWAKGGVMIRESLDAGSRFAIVFASPGNGVRFQARAITDTGATSDTAVATAEQIALRAPVWVKVERSGSTFNGYYSTDGVKWMAMSWNPQTINMVAPTIYIGLALTSHNANVPTTATFSGIATTGNVSAGPWQVAKIGADHPGNSQDPLYVAVEDSAGKIGVVPNPDPEAVLATTWTEWKIPLSSFTGVNLAKVKKLTIGVGDRKTPSADGTGRIYIDDIRVAKPQ